MSHQDKEDLRTPLAELKDLLAPIQKLRLKQIPRQGNAELNLTSVAMMALLAFGWSQKSTLGERFEFAHDELASWGQLGPVADNWCHPLIERR